MGEFSDGVVYGWNLINASCKRDIRDRIITVY